MLLTRDVKKWELKLGCLCMSYFIMWSYEYFNILQLTMRLH